ncbi:hypothetical protein [Streptomyces sp. NBC_01431]|uniref:hypothetical protein n=1 Tax=Streptomyces sp. NBC_01431 TaxID=2903863 RepID=UPI002E2F87F9|nr:hypothetical protein [Streptomyces sp. NBC_01431]
MSQREAVVVLEAAQVPAARMLAAEHGIEVEQVPRLGIEPVTTVTLVLLGAATAVGAVLHILEQRKGGQVIDLRPGAPKAFYRTPDVVYGTVIIVAVDGKVDVEVREPEGMFGKVISTLPELLAGGGDSIEQVAQSVTDRFGRAVEIETARTSDPGNPG